ncbi:c-type cytochrome [Ramlibacter sp. AN1133]|uniref:c-type cytochrome n=1 Tax=Ramlibacter sp. AN1133 TaxID=3133429 RepID=UPI0030BC6480
MTCPGGQRAVAVALCACGWLAGCQRMEGGSTTSAPAQARPAMQQILALPLGDVAGGQETPPGALQRNPYGGNPQAVSQGEQLFLHMNCAGCHGYGAKGGMGPNLTDHYWRYGGTPVLVFKSIYEGRPQGMPAWNPALPPDDIWKLVAYIQSLGGTFPAEDYQAWLQGDRAGINFPPEVARTVQQGASAPAPGAETATTSPAEARPDAGGKP